jgi:ArsR family transcriptional regulator
MNRKKIVESEGQADFCAMLGNPHRIQIIWVLGEQELTVSEIAKEIDTSMQNTSQHLRLMKNKGVLQSRRDGREIYYRVSDTEYTRECPITTMYNK